MSANTVALKITTIIVVIIIGLISFHAPLEVYFGTVFASHDLLIKSWKEILMVFASVILLPLAVNSRLASAMLADKLFIFIGGFGVLHLVLLVFFGHSSQASLAGLLIDLRFLLFFTLVYGLVRLRPSIQNLLLKTIIVAAAGVIIFGFLQVVILPPDILSHIGYSRATIAPYLTVDNNPAFVRINSTLRGPNPLGLYAGGVIIIGLSFLLSQPKIPKLRRAAVLAVLAFSVISSRLRRLSRPLLKTAEAKRIELSVGLIVFLIVAFVVLVHSYSRSALAAAVVGSSAVLFVRRWDFLARHWRAIIASSFFVIAATLFVFKDTSLVQQTLFHTDPLEASNLNSDQRHASSLRSASQDFARQPLGAGVGSTGSASLLGVKPNIIENQYLFVAHESGWLGLGLFIAIFGLTLKRLYAARQDYLSLGVFAIGVGLAVAGLVLPVFADDTIAIMWWGLAAIVLAPRPIVRQMS